MCNDIECIDRFSSTVTGETYKINHNFNCDAKCLVFNCMSELVYINYNIQVKAVTPFGSVGTITGAVQEK